MIIYNYHYWLNKLFKVFAASKLNVFFLIFITLSLIIYVVLSLNDERFNEEFFNTRLNNTIKKIELRDNGFHYKISSDWYLIKHPLVNHISIGDSIVKDSQSFSIKIKSGNEIKWDKDVRKNIIFRKDIK